MNFTLAHFEELSNRSFKLVTAAINLANRRTINLASHIFKDLAFPRRVLLIALILFAFYVEVGADQVAEQPRNQTPSVHWQAGDNPDFAIPSYDDSNWLPYRGLSEIPDDVFWIRAYFTIDESFVPSRNNTINLSGTGAFDIYLDGRQLGSSGVVGTSPEDESPGALQFKLGVPVELIDVGEHVLAIRASAHQLGDPSDFFISYQLGSTESSYSRNYLNLILLGVILATVGILSTFFAISGSMARQRRIFVTTITIAASVATLTGVETAKAIGVVPYTWREAAGWISAIAAILIVVCLPLMLLTRLDFKKWCFWLAGLLIVVAVSAPDWPGQAYEHDIRVFISLCVYGLAICTSAPIAERRLAIYYAIGLGTCLIGIVIDPDYKFLFLVALTLLLAIGFALDARSRELSAKQAQVAAAQLETEMLKRNLQPHFLMNSLTAITEWIETSPKDAVVFIQNLADELRFLTSLSGEKLISLKDEIKLCRAHIQTMGMRYKKTFNLETLGLNGNETIPPGVFHTMLENALSHNRYTSPLTTFTLEKTVLDAEITYRMSTPLGEATHHSDHSTGSGLRYIKSRLQESYPNRWRLTSEPANEHWITEIRVKD